MELENVRIDSRNDEISPETSQRSTSVSEPEATQSSPDGAWSMVRDAVLELTGKKPEDHADQPHRIPELFARIHELAIVPNLLPNVGHSSKRSRTSDPRIALLEHRRLVAGVEILLCFISTKNAYGQIVITSQLPNVLAALMQLCYAPIRSVESSKAPIPISVAGWLEHGDKIDVAIVDVDAVVAEMQRDRLRLSARLHKLTETLFQASVIESLFRILNAGNPKWFKKAVSTHISKEIVKENGLSNFLYATGQVFDRDTPWLQLEKVAMSVTRPPSTISDAEYTRNMGKQLKLILPQKRAKSETSLALAIINAFLTQKPDLGTEFVLKECFEDFVALLGHDSSSPAPTIPAERVKGHLELVQISCSVLPADSALIEAFALFMPLYLTLALASLKSGSAASSESVLLHVDTIVKVAASLSDGFDVVLACFNAHDRRFRMPERLLFSCDGRGDIGIGADGSEFVPSAESYRVLLQKLFVADRNLVCRMFSRLMDNYDRASDDDDDDEPDADLNFCSAWGIILPLLTDICEEAVESDEELKIQVIVSMKGIEKSKVLQERLKVLEVLLRSCRKLSRPNQQRIRAAVRHLEKVEGDLQSKAMALRAIILREYNEVEPYRVISPFVAWKYAPTALKILVNGEWKRDERAKEPRSRTRSAALSDEVPQPEPQRNKRSSAKEVYGEMSEYLKVKDEIMDPLVPVRGHGFVELRKLLAARDSEAGRDLDSLCTLCKKALEEEDSYIYLGAVQCYALIVTWRTSDFLPGLLDALRGTDCGDLKMKLTETLLRCVETFGDMSPVYCEMIVEAVLELCEDNDIDSPTKRTAASVLGHTMSHIPYRSRHFRHVLNILVQMMLGEDELTTRRAAAEGLSEGLKRMDKGVLITHYQTEVRDIHRVVRGLFPRCEDEALRIHLEETLLTLGEVAKTLLKSTGNNNPANPLRPDISALYK